MMMNASELENMHRSVIFDLNEGQGLELTYYKDVDIEPAILPLVEALNNEWTLTAHSCGGHWEDPPRFQCPYVHFYVLDDGPMWPDIVRRTWKTVKQHITPKATISVSEDYRLPRTMALWTHWRFRPQRSCGSAIRAVFRDEADFRETLDALIGATCRALKSACRETGDP